MLLLVAPAPPIAPPLTPPSFEGDIGAQAAVEEALRGAVATTAAQGAWPPGPWRVWVHPDAEAFVRATGAPPERSGQWVGDTLHLRPWEQLRRRDLGAVLRHELTHRRLAGKDLRRWEEEARCLWAEAHPRPPKAWPLPPAMPFQDRLDRALAGGTTGDQAWAYRWLRAWLRREPLPAAPPSRVQKAEAWVKEAATLAETITVVWPAERLRGPLIVNGQSLLHQPGKTWRFQGRARFQGGFPVRDLRGTIRIRAETRGWSLAWTTSRAAWVAAATEGELGAEAPFEARRALAAVLGRWVEGHHRQHPRGVLCPLTHCAVVRGSASVDSVRAVAETPVLELDPRWAFFTGSAGGRPLSPREVWGEGPEIAGTAAEAPLDRWFTWERSLSAAEVAALKHDLKPGLKQGQRGLRLGDSGPYAVEDLRLAAGRRFGWTAWPSNACEAESQPDGSLRLKGRGWGHNVGLCLATASFRARSGAKAEQILAEAFPMSWRAP
jgi:stage II sporulation protein D